MNRYIYCAVFGVILLGQFIATTESCHFPRKSFRFFSALSFFPLHLFPWTVFKLLQRLALYFFIHHSRARFCLPRLGACVIVCVYRVFFVVVPLLNQFRLYGIYYYFSLIPPSVERAGAREARSKDKKQCGIPSLTLGSICLRPFFVFIPHLFTFFVLFFCAFAFFYSSVGVRFVCFAFSSIFISIFALTHWLTWLVGAHETHRIGREIARAKKSNSNDAGKQTKWKRPKASTSIWEKVTYSLFDSLLFACHTTRSSSSSSAKRVWFRIFLSSILYFILRLFTHSMLDFFCLNFFFLFRWVFKKKVFFLFSLFLPPLLPFDSITCSVCFFCSHCFSNEREKEREITLQRCGDG